MATGKFISYLPVSTTGHGISGLDVRAQREAVAEIARLKPAKSFLADLIAAKAKPDKPMLMSPVDRPSNKKKRTLSSESRPRTVEAVKKR